jgi:preprotein translocase subunit SecA
MITRSIEGAQKRVELQNFQSRKRLLEYDDVMNQQREVVYSLRSFALEGGEELKGEARKMVERALARRIENGMADFDPENPDTWDPALLRQDLLMHYLLSVPGFEGEGAMPGSLPEAQAVATEAGRAAFAAKLESLTLPGDDGAEAQNYGGQLLALVMLNVLDEKWKDHLYDLDQLAAAIHYRSWGQKDPLVEYKQEAYTMFVDLMNDVANTFTERFLRAQLVFEQPTPEPTYFGPSHGEEPAGGRRVTKRYNALGILEDIPLDELDAIGDGNGDGNGNGEHAPEPGAGAPIGAVDIGPDQAPSAKPVARPDPVVVGAGRTRSLNPAAQANTLPANWQSTGRNDPCPCGSGKKFKKCHGAALK